MPALTQERIISITNVAAKHQETIENIRRFSSTIISYISELLQEEKYIEAQEQLNILSAQLRNYTDLDSTSIRIVETERAYFNNRRVKYNLYMRDAQRRSASKKRAKTEELEIEHELNFITSKTKKEVPLIAAIEEDEEHLIRSDTLNQRSTKDHNSNNLNSTLNNSPECSLKEKFGETFVPLPLNIGLPPRK